VFAVVVREIGDADEINSHADEVNQNVAPRVRELPAFVSALWMTDGAGHTLNVLVFDNEHAAKAGVGGARNAPRPPYMKVESVELYRVLAKA
jgi:hypothetical protein